MTYPDYMQDAANQERMDRRANWQMEERRRMAVVVYLAACWVIAVGAIVAVVVWG